MPATAQATATPDTRERILEAALQAFSEKGFDGATTREIATRAGVNLGLIQYYFEGKDKLWREAVDRAFETLRQALEGIGDEAVLSDPDRARLLIRRYVRFVAANPEFVRLMHDEGKRDSPRMRWLVDRHVRSLFEGMTGVFEKAQQRGLLPESISPLHFHYILAGAVGIIFHQAEECKRLAGVDPTDPTVVEAHADAVVHLLLGPEETS